MSVTKVTGMMQTSTKGGDISSASPTVIDSDGDYFDIAGTTNFAAFTVTAGRRFTVQFDGALTMTHHATNLDLPGGANITTAAGDVAEFFATGTNTVQCVNYTKADGTAVVAAAGGAWNIIGTSVASGSATLSQTGLDSTYDCYAIVLSDLVPAGDGQNLCFRVGDSSGYDSGASDYTKFRTNQSESGDSFAAQADTGDPYTELTGDTGNAAGEGVGGIIYILRPGDGTTQPIYWGLFTGISSSGVLRTSYAAGHRQAVITLDRVQVFFTSSNITTGRMTVYGIAHA